MYIAIDLGAESGRVILGALDRDHLVLTEIHRFVNRPVLLMGHLHWNLLSLYEEILTGLRRAAQQEGDIRGIGVDSWGVDYGLLARDRSILGFPYAYRDSRTEGMMERVFDLVSRESLYEVTGIQFMPFNTLFQLFSMVSDKSPILDVADRLLLMPNLIHYLLTGECVSEYTIASTSQALDARKRAWTPELLDRLEIPAHMFPPLIDPGTCIGPLKKEIAGDTNIRSAEVIAPACHDTASAVAAVPASGEDWAYLSSGTWSLMGIETREPIITSRSLACNFTNEGGVNRTIRFLRNIAGLWLLQECRRKWERSGQRISYAQLTAEAEDAPQFKTLIDPDDPQFLNPADMPEAIVRYCRDRGQPAPETMGEFVRCILESLALKYRYTLDQIRELCENPIHRLHIVGGGSQNRLLNQFTASASGLPVVTGPVEATAAGNIMLQMMADGELDSLAQGRALVARSFPLEQFDPLDNDSWRDAYGRFRSMIARSMP